VAGPDTRYTRSGSIHLAWQTWGSGSDLVYVPTLMQQIEKVWELPQTARFFEALGSFCRVITFDRRGIGLSDPAPVPPTLEEQMDDVEAVMDAAGSEQATLFAQAEGGAMAALFAATHPDRVRALVLWAPLARNQGAPGYEWAGTAEERAKRIDGFIAHWGDGSYIEQLAPSLADDPETRRWFGSLQRHAMSPGTARATMRSGASVDVRDVLPLITAPTLILHRDGDRAFDIRHSEYFAAHVPGARFVRLSGQDNLISAGDLAPFIDEVAEIVTGSRRPAEPDRVLATVLFTDIVNSTGHAAQLGDRDWRSLLAGHDELTRREVERHRGRTVKSLGDGWLATFDGPARAIRCALAVRAGLRGLGLELRAGLHTGECEVSDDDVTGLAVHIAARVQAAASPGEVLTSGTVKDLVVGSGLEFAERGERELRGVPGTWRLFAVGS
jgi:class 3 adenylate cyclase/alpha-beta hydrolase superfamily lysophospholipase